MATTQTAQQQAQAVQVAQESTEKEKSWLDSGQEWMTRNLGIAGTILGGATLGVAKAGKNLLTGNFSDLFSMDTLKSVLSLGTVAGGVYGISALRKSNKSLGNTAMWGVGGLLALSALSSFMSNDNDKQATQTTGSATKQLAQSGATNITNPIMGNSNGVTQVLGNLLGGFGK